MATAPLCCDAGKVAGPLRNWVFEGSDDGTAWAVLHTHTNDTSLNAGWATAGWALDREVVHGQAFRFLRIRGTGPNSNNNNHVFCGGIELFGLATVV